MKNPPLVAFVCLAGALLACRQSSDGWNESDRQRYQDDCLKELGRKQGLGAQSISLCKCMGPKAETRFKDPKQARGSAGLATILKECQGTPATTTASGKFVVGQKVEVLWKGKYYPATVLSVTGDQYKIHYDGFSAKWDETVGPSRIRAPAAGGATVPPG